MTMHNGIEALIHSAKRRIRWAWYSSAASDVVPHVLFVLGIVGAGSWAIGRALPWWIYVVVFVVANIALLGASRFREVDDVQAARAIEKRVGRDGVLISALEFHEPDDDWHREVQRRAIEVAQLPDAHRAIPIRANLRRTLVALAAVAMVAAAGVVAPIAGPGIAAADQDRLDIEATALDDVAALLEDAADDADDPLEADSLDEAAVEIRRLAEEIRSAESPLDAAERLEREAETLREEAGTDLLTDKAAVQGLEQQLSASPLSSGATAASQLDSLASELDTLTKAERDELADRLDSLASSQTTGNREVADALAATAASLRAGDVGAAGASLASAAAAQRSAAAGVSARDAASAAATAADGAAGRLRDADASGSGRGEGSGNGDGDGSGEGNGDGNGDGSGDGSGSGQGEGSGQGRGVGGGNPSGQVAGASPSGEQQQGQGGVGTPGQGDAAPGETGVEQAAEVFDPVQAGASEEVDVDIDGGTGEGQIAGRSDSATSEGDSFVPYQDVLPGYLDSAAAALDELDLPPDLRSTVRDYFDQIAER